MSSITWAGLPGVAPSVARLVGSMQEVMLMRKKRLRVESLSAAFQLILKSDAALERRLAAA